MLKIILEADKSDKIASEMLRNARIPAFSGISDMVVNLLKTNDIHAFNHCPPWMEKYIKGIIRMLIEEADGDYEKAKRFLSGCSAVFDAYLTWCKLNRPERDKTRNEDPVTKAFDNHFIEEMSYDDVKRANREHLKQVQKDDDERLNKMSFNAPSRYKIVPIESYRQLNSMYGGTKTGNPNNEDSDWCHANDQTVYEEWVGDGSKMFVLEREGWQDIPFDEETNEEYRGKDDYGNSLIAILVSPEGDLTRSTLRCNHEGVDGIVDFQYRTYSDLSNLTGMNVKSAIKSMLKEGYSRKRLTL